MKRLLKYDAIIAGVALLLWIALVIVEVKVRELWFFRYVFWSSLILLFFAFPVAGGVAFVRSPKQQTVAVVVSFFLTPVFIALGVLLVSYFKIAIGGHPS